METITRFVDRTSGGLGCRQLRYGSICGYQHPSVRVLEDVLVRRRKNDIIGTLDMIPTDIYNLLFSSRPRNPAMGRILIASFAPLVTLFPAPLSKAS